MPYATETVFHGPINARHHRELKDRLRALEHDEGSIAERLHELDREWDLDRAFFLAAGAVVLTMGIVHIRQRKRFSPAVVAGSFLLARALFGWAPPLVPLRLASVRTRQEIEHERIALRALRGDFGTPLSPERAFATAEAEA